MVSLRITVQLIQTEVKRMGPGVTLPGLNTCSIAHQLGKLGRETGHLMCETGIMTVYGAGHNVVRIKPGNAGMHVKDLV